MTEVVYKINCKDCDQVYIGLEISGNVNKRTQTQYKKKSFG